LIILIFIIEVKENNISVKTKSELESRNSNGNNSNLTNTENNTQNSNQNTNNLVYLNEKENNSTSIIRLKQSTDTYNTISPNKVTSNTNYNELSLLEKVKKITSESKVVKLFK